MIKNYIENANFEDTGFAYTLSLISGKHKMVILYCLMEFETVRFNELKRYLKTISDKTLSTNLKELEKDRLIIRTEYPQIPPKVVDACREKNKEKICHVLSEHYMRTIRRLLKEQGLSEEDSGFSFDFLV